MLKQVIINRKAIPVPIPIKDLAQALQWIEQTLLKSDQVITRIALDGVFLDEDGAPSVRGFDEISLKSQSRLELQVDAPIDLAIQTLDAVRNLTAVIQQGVKHLAVECWQALPSASPEAVESTITDAGMITELFDHFLGLTVNLSINSENIKVQSEQLRQTLTALQMAKSNSDWRAFARLLLNRLDKELDQITTEAAAVQSQIFTLKVERRGRSASAVNS